MFITGGGVGVSPPILRLMAFIDGENLVFRYQEMLQAGWQAKSDIVHDPDVLVWQPYFSMPGTFEAVRATYYTSVVGDENRVREIERKLKATRFGNFQFAPTQSFLYPCVFKRPANSRKTSVVDIQLAVESLSHAYQGNADTILILSGDGDFAALVREIAARGRRVFVGSFSAGRSEELERYADRLIDLDQLFFNR